MALEFINSSITAPQGDQYRIVEAGITEDAEGWYFPYQTARFLETRDLEDSVVGNWPVFVSRASDVVEIRQPPHFR
jgi:hypothetical protein